MSGEVLSAQLWSSKRLLNAPAESCWNATKSTTHLLHNTDTRTEMWCDDNRVSARYHLGMSLGFGAEGEVFYATEKARSRPDDDAPPRHVVIKKRLAPPGVRKVAESCAHELAVLQELRGHDNIVELIEHVLSTRAQFFVLERMHADLFAVVTAAGTDEAAAGISEEQAQLVVRDVTSGLMAMHRHHYSHNDVKPENVLIEFCEDMETIRVAKLADFGFAQQHADEKLLGISGSGTVAYMAPEVLKAAADELLGQSPAAFDAAASDVFALGVTLFVAVVGRFPFTRPLNSGTAFTSCGSYAPWLQKVLSRGAREPAATGLATKQGLSPEVQQLILDMLEDEPQRRAALTQVAQSAWLQPTRPAPSAATLPSRCSSADPDSEDETAMALLELFGEDDEDDYDAAAEEEIGLITSTPLRGTTAGGSEAEEPAAAAADDGCASPVFDSLSSPMESPAGAPLSFCAK